MSNFIAFLFSRVSIWLLFACSMAFAASTPNRIDALTDAAAEQVYRDPGKAESLAREALQLVDENTLFEDRYRANITLSDALVEQDRYQEALQILNTMLLEADNLDSTILKAQILSRTSEIYWYQGKIYDAVDKLETTLKLYQAAGRPDDVSKTLNNLGIMFRHLGDYESALSYLLRSLAIKETLDNKTPIATTLNNIGVIYHQLEKYQEAISYFDRAIEIFEFTSDDPGLADPLNNKGQALEQLGQYPDALEYYQRSLTIERATQNIRGQSISHARIGAVLRKMQRFDDAKGQLALANELAQKTQSPTVLSESLLQQGLLYLDLQQYGLAEKALNQGLQLATESSEKEKISELHFHLSKVYEKAENYSSALQHFRLYKQISEELLNANTRERITRLQFKNKLEQREQEINLLKQQNKIQSLEVEQTQSRQTIIIAFSITFVVSFGLLLGVIYHRKRLTREQEISDQLITLDKLKTQFLMQASNELLTPLAQIKQVSEFNLKQLDRTSSEFKALNAIEKYSEKLEIIIRNLLDFSADKNQKLTIATAPVQVNEVVKYVIDVLHQDLSNLEVGRLSFSFNNQVPDNLPNIIGDQQRLVQCFYNIVQRFITRLQQGTLYFHAIPMGERLLVRVSNQPLDESHESLPNDDKWASMPFEMTLVQRLITLQNGEIWIDEHDNDYTVCFTLPLEN
ncbi:MAG: tetratricopeptide repeat-containing sensor histidine kinase [Gammaproteobacteria bacterium]|nr:tetratricopeptide repeat-containing sensor histidine kinase [Gammaproteobacteria bacterium]